MNIFDLLPIPDSGYYLDKIQFSLERAQELGKGAGPAPLRFLGFKTGSD